MTQCARDANATGLEARGSNVQAMNAAVYVNCLAANTIEALAGACWRSDAKLGNEGSSAMRNIDSKLGVDQPVVMIRAHFAEMRKTFAQLLPKQLPKAGLSRNGQLQLSHRIRADAENGVSPGTVSSALPSELRSS